MSVIFHYPIFLGLNPGRRRWFKEAAGYMKEEADEHGASADSQKKAQEGRNLRNEGRMEDGKAPKVSKPGSEDN